jgi:hypothetical protein
MNKERLFFKDKARERIMILAISIAFIQLFETCTKDGTEAVSYEITGQLYSGCPKQPASNKEIRLHMLQANNQGSSLIAITTTDNAGHFKLKASYWDAILICDNQYIATLRRENISNIEIHINALTFLKVNLNVSNPYSTNDTLFIKSQQHGEYIAKVPGPFNSGFLLNDSSYAFDKGFVLNNSNYTQIPEIYYFINNYTLYPDTAYINANLCDTSTVTLEIN